MVLRDFDPEDMNASNIESFIKQKLPAEKFELYFV